MIIFNIYIYIYIYVHEYQNYDYISMVMSIHEHLEHEFFRSLQSSMRKRQGHFTVVDMGGNIALHNAKYNRHSG